MTINIIKNKQIKTTKTQSKAHGWKVSEKNGIKKEITKYSFCLLSSKKHTWSLWLYIIPHHLDLRVNWGNLNDYQIKKWGKVTPPDTIKGFAPNLAENEEVYVNVRCISVCVPSGKRVDWDSASTCPHLR